MNGSIWTLIVVTGGVAPVNNGDRFVSVKVPAAESMLPTLPLTCDGHKRTRSAVIVVTPPVDMTVPGRIWTSCPTIKSAELLNLKPRQLKPPPSPISATPTWKLAFELLVTSTEDPSELPFTS